MPCSMLGMLLIFVLSFFKLFKKSFSLFLISNQPQVDISIIDIFFSASFDFLSGMHDGGKKTTTLPFAFATKLSIVGTICF